MFHFQSKEEFLLLLALLWNPTRCVHANKPSWDGLIVDKVESLNLETMRYTSVHFEHFCMSPTILYSRSARVARAWTLFSWGDSSFIAIIHLLGPFIVIDIDKGVGKVTIDCQCLPDLWCKGALPVEGSSQSWVRHKQVLICTLLLIREPSSYP